jgi:phage gp46-like protein
MRDISPSAFTKIDTPARELLSLSQVNHLQNSIMISLCTNRKADPPFHEASGWWADALSSGDETGSALFTLARGKKTEETLDAALFYAQQSLEWLKKRDPKVEIAIDAKIVAQDINVTVDITGSQLAKQARIEAVVV